MDNKITKSRLSNLLSYEWLLIIVILVGIIAVYEFLYAFFGVRLTTGQTFNYYYDVGVYGNSDNDFIDFLSNDNPFSYDIFMAKGEVIDPNNNLLTTYLNLEDGDILFTSSLANEDGTKDINSKVDDPIYCLYDFNKLLGDAQNYLRCFLKDEFALLSKEEQNLKIKDKDNLSIQKIEARFDNRMKKDNRFRSIAQKIEGRQLEVQRINRLVKEVDDFSYLLQVGEEKDIFYRYTRYSQIAQVCKESEKEIYQREVQREIEEGRENAPFGIKLENLTGGEHDTSEFFKLYVKNDKGDTVLNDTSKNVVMMAFDFVTYQPDLQFECISFINRVVRGCSDIYNGR